MKLPKVDPVAIAVSVADVWRQRELGKKLVRKLFPRLAARRAAKRAQRTARNADRPRQHDEAAGEFFSADQEVSMLEGKKAWIGVATVLLGLALNLFGVGQCSPEELAAATCVPAETIVATFMAALDQILIAVGSIVTMIGVEHKRRREKKLKAQVSQAKQVG